MEFAFYKNKEQLSIHFSSGEVPDGRILFKRLIEDEKSCGQPTPDDELFFRQFYYIEKGVIITLNIELLNLGARFIETVIKQIPEEKVDQIEQLSQLVAELRFHGLRRAFLLSGVQYA